MMLICQLNPFHLNSCQCLVYKVDIAYSLLVGDLSSQSADQIKESAFFFPSDLSKFSGSMDE